MSLLYNIKQITMEYKQLKESLTTYSQDWMEYCLWEDIRELLWEEFDQFENWMRGQSSFMEWPYLDDVGNYFYNKEKGTLDKFPHGY